MKRLIETGFIKVGTWTLSGSGIKFLLTSHFGEKKVLYSFVCGEKVLYIGKTNQSLTNRMKGYQKPGPTQSTNIRVKKNMIQLLEGGLPIDIYILTDKGLIKYGDYTISIAGGLEDILIEEFKPDWNISGKTVKIKSVKRHQIAKTHQVKPQEIDSTTFEVILSPSYYNQGFFNVRRKYSERFGNDKDPIKIQLGHKPDSCINGIIDRHANNNGSPRIRGRKPLTDWIKLNLNQGDVMLVKILSPTSIRITNPKFRV